MERLRQPSQKMWPQFVVTRERPASVKVLLLSMHMGQVMSGDTGDLESGVVVSECEGVEGVAPGGGAGEGGMKITSSSTPDITTSSLLGVSLPLGPWCPCGGEEVRSTTTTEASLSLSAVRSTTSLPFSPSMLTQDDELEEDRDMGRRLRSLQLPSQNTRY